MFKEEKSKKVTTPEEKAKTFANFIRIVLVIGLVWYFFGGGLEKQTQVSLHNIENQVAGDSVTQYGIAQRSGSTVDKCVQAGMVVAAYLQAKDEANYQKWKAVQSKDCKRAGLSY